MAVRDSRPGHLCSHGAAGDEGYDHQVPDLDDAEQSQHCGSGVDDYLEPHGPGKQVPAHHPVGEEPGEHGHKDVGDHGGEDDQPRRGAGVVLRQVVGQPAPGDDYGPSASIGGEGGEPEVAEVSVGEGGKESGLGDVYRISARGGFHAPHYRPLCEGWRGHLTGAVSAG